MGVEQCQSMENYTVVKSHEKRWAGAHVISVNECETVMSFALMIFKTSSCAVCKSWLLTLGVEGCDHSSALPIRACNKPATQLLGSHVISCGLQSRLEDGNIGCQLRSCYQEADV